MSSPKISENKTFEEVETQLDIRNEIDDIRSHSLGAHPSKSFYWKKEPTVNLKASRAQFDRAAKRY